MCSVATDRSLLFGENVAVCCGYCREQWVCAVGTVGNSVCVLSLLKGRVCVCRGYCRVQWLYAVGTVGNSVCVLCEL